jgi:hypothetical protein
VFIVTQIVPQRSAATPFEVKVLVKRAFDRGTADHCLAAEVKRKTRNSKTLVDPFTRRVRTGRPLTFEVKSG